MTSPVPPTPAPLTSAIDAYLRGNLQKADLMCRRLLSEDGDHTAAWLLLARIAEQVGSTVHARNYLQLARQHAPGVEIHDIAGATAQPPAHPRYLLIKAWGYGFCADLDHVYGALLLAELTGRVPMVHWGRNSLFRDPDTDNAFESFFEPVSGVQWSDLLAPQLTYFPSKWNAGNLRAAEVAKWSGSGARMTGMYFLNRPENVLVSDYHIKINDLMPWIPPHHPLHGLQRHELYRHLNEKYLRIKPHLQERVDALWAQQMTGKSWLAVHVRGTDKVQEIHNLADVNRAYDSRIDKILSVNPALHIFLLTDSVDVVAQYRARYGDRIHTLDCQRGTGDTGVHLEGQPSTALGEQVLTDILMASRCDFFLGNGGSNVSTAVRHLRHWSPGTFFLIGPDFLGSIDLSLHEW